MAPPTLAFLRVDARRPLDDATVDLDDPSSRGFVKLEARLHPEFNASDASRREYDVLVSAKASHLNVMATSFAPGSSITIDGVAGNMATRRASDGTRVEVVVATSGGETTTYALTTRVSSEIADEGEAVMKEKPKVEDDGKSAHGHSHDGVPCDGTHHSHSHGHDHSGEKCGHDHGHGHGHGEKKCVDDKCCDDDKRGHDHDHGHGHGEKKCDDDKCDHDHGHGHAHGEKKCDDDKCGHDHGHEHAHGEKKCDDDKCGHDHDHGHDA